MKIKLAPPLFASAFQIPPYDSVGGDYSHEIGVDGGFKSATISFPIDMTEMGYWLSYGLGLDVTSYGDNAETAWNGFVNSIAVNLGPLTYTRGPLNELGNRVTVKYTDFTVGQAARTTAQNDTISQSRYGIWHKIVSAGTISATNAAKIRDTYLQENKHPQTSVSISSSGGDPVMTLSCLGYGEFLKFPYNQATDTTYTLREKVLEVLGQEPNGILSTVYSNIEANDLSINRLDNDDRLGSEILSELVSLGGASDNYRRLLGVYEDRVVYLQPIPSTVTYTIKGSAQGSPVLDALTGAVVSPWNLRPGNWLRLLDASLMEVEAELGDVQFALGSSTVRELRKHPSLVFIESVSFTAPYDFSINGGKTDTLSAQLAKLNFN